MVTARRGTSVTEPAEPADLRAEFSELVRVRLRDAAARMFAEQGYKGATVRQIARLAGLTHTTFYKYYRSKEAVLYAILAEIGPEVRRFFERIPTVANDEAAFSGWFGDYSAFWASHRRVYLAFWEAMFADPAIAERTRMQLRPIARGIAEAMLPQNADIVDRGTEATILWLHTIDYTLFLIHMTAREAEATAAQAAGRRALWHGLDAIVSSGRSSA